MKSEQELKDIRDKYDEDMNSTTPYNVELPYSVIMKIQSETYQLGKQAGREDVINEIEKIVNEAKAKDLKEQFGLNTMVVLSVIQAKLNNLKK